jgi:Na+-translocating ferredoxin:NAD+ oxidoreductase subunit B
MIEMTIPPLSSIAVIASLAAGFGLFLSIALLKLGAAAGHGAENVLDAMPAATAPAKARVRCRGGIAETTDRFTYEGPRDCAAADGVIGGYKTCRYGCLGFGDCVRSCPRNAISMNENGLPDVDPVRCDACGLCVAACPRAILFLAPEKNDIHVMCNNEEKPREMKQGCSVGCIACKLCETACRGALEKRYPEKDPASIEPAIRVDNYLARIDYDLCIQCYRCVEVCPVPVIHPLARSAKLQGKPDNNRKPLNQNRRETA